MTYKLLIDGGSIGVAFAREWLAEFAQTSVISLARRAT